MVSVEDDDDDSDGDDDALSWYDAAIGLVDLPDICPFLEPVGGSTSQASGLAPVTVEVEKEMEEVGIEAGPLMGGAASSGTPQEGSMTLPPRAQAPWVPAVVGMTPPASSSGAPPTGVRTQGQLASEA
jgi:hypothetical protein